MTLAQQRRQKLYIIISHLFGRLGSGIFSFGIGLMILRETGSASNFGFSQIIGPVVSLLLLPLTGSVIDRLNHKKIVITAQICSIGGILLFLAADRTALLPRLSLIYILLTILAVADLFLETTYESSMVNMVAADDVQQILSIKQIVRTVCMIAAPILGALLYQLLSFEFFISLEIASEIITLLLVFGIHFYMFQESPKTEKDEAEQPEALSGLRGMLTMFKEGLDFIKASPMLNFLMIFSMLINFLIAGVTAGLPFVQIQVFRLTDTEYGITEAAFAAGLLAVSITLAGRKEMDKPMYQAWRLIMVVFGLLLGIAGLIYGRLPHTLNFGMLTALLAVLGGLIGMINIPLNLWSIKNIPSKMQGRVFNLMGTSSQLLMPLGILLFGFLLDYPVRSDLLFAVLAVAGMVLTFFLPRMLKVSLQEI